MPLKVSRNSLSVAHFAYYNTVRRFNSLLWRYSVGGIHGV